jgi:hypothetical protein
MTRETQNILHDAPRPDEAAAPEAPATAAPDGAAAVEAPVVSAPAPALPLPGPGTVLEGRWRIVDRSAPTGTLWAHDLNLGERTMLLVPVEAPVAETRRAVARWPASPALSVVEVIPLGPGSAVVLSAPEGLLPATDVQLPRETFADLLSECLGLLAEAQAMAVQAEPNGGQGGGPLWRLCATPTPWIAMGASPRLWLSPLPYRPVQGAAAAGASTAADVARADRDAFIGWCALLLWGASEGTATSWVAQAPAALRPLLEAWRPAADVLGPVPAVEPFARALQATAAPSRTALPATALVRTASAGSDWARSRAELRGRFVRHTLWFAASLVLLGVLFPVVLVWFGGSIGEPPPDPDWFDGEQTATTQSIGAVAAAPAVPDLSRNSSGGGVFAALGHSPWLRGNTFVPGAPNAGPSPDPDFPRESVSISRNSDGSVYATERGIWGQRSPTWVQAPHPGDLSEVVSHRLLGPGDSLIREELWTPAVEGGEWQLMTVFGDHGTDLATCPVQRIRTGLHDRIEERTCLQVENLGEHPEGAGFGCFGLRYDYDASPVLPSGVECFDSNGDATWSTEGWSSLRLLWSPSGQLTERQWWERSADPPIGVEARVMSEVVSLERENGNWVVEIRLQSRTRTILQHPDGWTRVTRTLFGGQLEASESWWFDSASEAPELLGVRALTLNGPGVIVQDEWTSTTGWTAPNVLPGSPRRVVRRWDSSRQILEEQYLSLDGHATPAPDWDGAVSRTFERDEIGRVTMETRAYLEPRPREQRRFTYDPQGNLVRVDREWQGTPPAGASHGDWTTLTIARDLRGRVQSAEWLDTEGRTAQRGFRSGWGDWYSRIEFAWPESGGWTRATLHAHERSGTPPIEVRRSFGVRGHVSGIAWYNVAEDAPAAVTLGFWPGQVAPAVTLVPRSEEGSGSEPLEEVDIDAPLVQATWLPFTFTQGCRVYERADLTVDAPSAPRRCSRYTAIHSTGFARGPVPDSLGWLPP